jgi:hypothetical protein
MASNGGNGGSTGPAPPGGGSSSGGVKATDALDAFLSAAESQFKRADLGSPDPDVSLAFALGWQMAELYRPDRRGSYKPADTNDLPGVSSLTLAEQTVMGASQLSAGIARLGKRFQDAGLEVPDASGLAQAVAGAPQDDRDRTIRSFHVELLSRLTAADFRLGKAYGLGRALADTTRDPPNPAAEFPPHRVATLTGWIRDLATALPPHAAHPVADSVTAWGAFFGTENSPQAPGSKAEAPLSAQGRLWRSLLSGEKSGPHLLEIADYLGAGAKMVDRSLQILWAFIKRYWWIVTAVIVLFVVGIALVAASASPLVTGVGASSILASLGLSWKGIGTSLGTAAVRVEQPLWEAQVDAMIYRRITPNVVLAVQPPEKDSLDEPSLQEPSAK